MSYLVNISIYPIKSLDGVTVTQAEVLDSGALKHDREFAIFDEQGHVVNGKRTDKVHGVRSTFDLTTRTVSLKVQGKQHTEVFHLDDNRKDLAAWLSEYFNFSVKLLQNTEMGFPDDTAASGPTIISSATLATVASWFPGVSLEEIRIRFRTNLEIAGVPAFWEDQLFAAADQVVYFQVGSVLLAGVNPCQRCVVPARNSLTGSKYTNFQKTFVAQRKASLPSWATPSRFNHFFRLAVNTRLGELSSSRMLQVGESVQILSTGLV